LGFGVRRARHEHRVDQPDSIEECIQHSSLKGLDLSRRTDTPTRAIDHQFGMRDVIEELKLS